MDQRYLSTAEASKALGVSVSTVKRWVDDGILPAHKTAGGHRKLLLSDVVRLGRSGKLPNLDMTRLEMLGAQDVPRDRADLATRAYRALEAGDGANLRSLVLGAYQTGVGIDELFDDILLPAVEGNTPDGEISEGFRRQQAVQECKSALYELKNVLELRASRQCPLAVGGAAGGDHDPLYSLLIQIVLLDAGWEPINLGPNTPADSFAAAVAELRPRLVWATFRQPVHDEAVIDEFNKMARQAMAQGVSIVVHGPGLADSQRRRTVYSAYADRMQHIAAFAQTIHPAPRIPRRGRPSLDAPMH